MKWQLATCISALDREASARVHVMTRREFARAAAGTAMAGAVVGPGLLEIEWGQGIGLDRSRPHSRRQPRSGRGLPRLRAGARREVLIRSTRSR